MRLFIGLPVPPGVARVLTRHAQSIDLPKVRWTAPENVHITLVFLGEVAERRIPPIAQAIDALAPPVLTVRLTTLGTFPQAGVLLAEVESEPALLQLQSAVCAAMVRCGFPSEQRSFQPHITLARFRPPARLTRNEVTLPPEVPRAFAVAVVNLYHSIPTPTGSRYEVLARKNSVRE